VITQLSDKTINWCLYVQPIANYQLVPLRTTHCKPSTGAFTYNPHYSSETKTSIYPPRCRDVTFQRLNRLLEPSLSTLSLFEAFLNSCEQLFYQAGRADSLFRSLLSAGEGLGVIVYGGFVRRNISLAIVQQQQTLLELTLLGLQIELAEFYEALFATLTE
jgi:hypothetical protein